MRNRVAVCVVGAVAALGLGCGAQPNSYVVAVDQSGLAALPGSCYPGGTAPGTPPQIVQFVQHELTVWDGAQNKHYLEIDQFRVNFPANQIQGGAGNVTFQGLAEGGPKSWAYSSTSDRGNNVTENRSMAFSFTDLSGTLLGTVAVSDTFSCATPPCGFPDCTLTLNLNGRQLDTQPTGGL